MNTVSGEGLLTISGEGLLTVSGEALLTVSGEALLTISGEALLIVSREALLTVYCLLLTQKSESYLMLILEIVVHHRRLAAHKPNSDKEP